MFSNFFDKVDDCLFYAITKLPKRNPNMSEDENLLRKKRIAEEIEGHLITRKHMNGYEGIFHIFGVIDTKAGALLTHISVMIAANALLLSVETPMIWNVLSILMLFAFIMLALLTLRLLRFWSVLPFPGANADERPQKDVEAEIEQSFHEEIFYRGKLYRFNLNGTTMMTAFSIVLLITYAISMAS